MSFKTKIVSVVASAAFLVALEGLIHAEPTHAHGAKARHVQLAQSDPANKSGDTKSKSRSTDPAGKNGTAPGNSAPGNAPKVESPSPTLQPSAPQAGVPARCASITDAAERQKCVNTPMGQ